MAWRGSARSQGFRPASQGRVESLGSAVPLLYAAQSPVAETLGRLSAILASSLLVPQVPYHSSVRFLPSFQTVRYLETCSDYRATLSEAWDKWKPQRVFQPGQALVHRGMEGQKKRGLSQTRPFTDPPLIASPGWPVSITSPTTRHRSLPWSPRWDVGFLPHVPDARVSRCW